MPEVNRTFYFPKDKQVGIFEIKDGIYRISGFVEEYGMTFNQFLIKDSNSTLIQSGWLFPRMGW